MAPAKPTPLSPVVGPKSRAAPTILAGKRRSGRIEKTSALEKEQPQKLKRQRKQGLGRPETDKYAEEDWDEPDSDFTQDQLPRLPKIRTSRTKIAPAGNEVADRGKKNKVVAKLYHTIQGNGPKQKTIGELLAEVDTQKNFRIPTNLIIADEKIDTRVREQMVRAVQNGNLTPARVRSLLANATNVCEVKWYLRDQSRAVFWSQVGKSGGWLSSLDGVDCRQFFLCMCACFEKGSGKKPTNAMTKGFEKLHRLLEMENNSELDDLIKPATSLSATASGFQESTRATVSSRPRAKKAVTKAVPKDGNIFHWSASTNMSDFELLAVDEKGLKPITDVGTLRMEREEREKRFKETMDANEKESAAGAAHMLGPVRARKRVPGRRVATPPFDIDNLGSKIDGAPSKVQPDKERSEAGAADSQEHELNKTTRKHRVQKRHEARRSSE